MIPLKYVSIRPVRLMLPDRLADYRDGPTYDAYRAWFEKLSEWTGHSARDSRHKERGGAVQPASNGAWRAAGCRGADTHRLERGAIIAEGPELDCVGHFMSCLPPYIMYSIVPYCIRLTTEC